MFLIPKTSKKKYLSKMAALNIFDETSKELCTGDWHYVTMFNNGFRNEDAYLAGEGMKTNTNAYLGDLEVNDVTNPLKKMGYYEKHVIDKNSPVYCASHARACVDLLFSRIKNNAPLDSIRLDDWFITSEAKKTVYRLIDILYFQVEKNIQLKIDEWKASNPCEES